MLNILVPKARASTFLRVYYESRKSEVFESKRKTEKFDSINI